MAFLAVPEVAAVAGEGAAAARGAVAARGARSGARGPGRAAGKGKKAQPRKLTPDLSPDEVNAELQQRRQAAAAAKQQPAAPTAPATSSTSSGPSTPKFMTNPDGSPGWWPKQGGAQRTANAGGGFLLGTFGYVLALTYLRGGSAGVKQLLRAKFLNKTGA